MYRYNLKLRLGGSANNEVLMEKCSAAEVTLLRHLHGSDAVVDLVEGSNDKSEHAKEREKLFAKYTGHGMNRTPIDFGRLFGPAHTDLPGRLREFAVAAEEKAWKEDPNKIQYKKPVKKVDIEGAIDPDDIAG